MKTSQYPRHLAGYGKVIAVGLQLVGVLLLSIAYITHFTMLQRSHPRRARHGCFPEHG